MAFYSFTIDPLDASQSFQDQIQNQDYHLFIHQSDCPRSGCDSIEATPSSIYPTAKRHRFMPIEYQEPEPSDGSDDYGYPIKRRKKPGRKPNLVSPAERKAQNRAAQRAFRERRERHLQTLETTVRTLREEHDHTSKKLEKCKEEIETLKLEKWYLRGAILSIRFFCMQQNMPIPEHAPYFEQEELNNLTKCSPQAAESYMRACAANDAWLNASKSVLEPDLTEEGSKTSVANHKEQNTSLHVKETDNNLRLKQSESSKEVLKQHDLGEFKEASSTASKDTLELANIRHIQWTRLNMRVQSIVAAAKNQHARMEPTIIQKRIPHDSRVDLVTGPYMRNLLIIYRDMVDIDLFVELLVDKAFFAGGDPFSPANYNFP
ncbi:hypothetical protein EC973_001131 [Apophysomyces ossiformis]|uniref:BZIP domain-containing protein n=1 Tax=Apophysomyces ossiformis TaxID=679940 RepID=A0A8H7EMM2_9FUNG|nr:hypothetical protein EC973_001131 [Apophysomyces ossiformis]